MTTEKPKKSQDPFSTVDLVQPPTTSGVQHEMNTTFICRRCVSTALRTNRRPDSHLRRTLRTSKVPNGFFPFSTTSSVRKAPPPPPGDAPSLSSSSQSSGPPSRVSNSTAGKPSDTLAKTTVTNSDASSTVSAINPPSSTLPPPLFLPEYPSPPSRTEDLPLKTKLYYYFNLGRAYLSFYKSGLSSLWTNYKHSQNIYTRLESQGYPLPPFTALHSPGFRAAVTHHALTRAEYQVLHRSRQDVRKLLPFGLVFAICGEFTPLVIVAIGSGVVPGTCRIPKQVKGDREALARRRKDVWREVDVDELVARARVEGVKGLETEEVGRLCTLMGLSKTEKLWPMIGGWQISVRKQRLWKWWEYLEFDDTLMRAGGGVDGMDEVEVSRAVEERGGMVDEGRGSDGEEKDLEGKMDLARQKEWLREWVEKSTSR